MDRNETPLTRTGTDRGVRDVRDVVIVCCGGLTRPARALLEEGATVQHHAVHLIRVFKRFVGYGCRKTVALALKPIYTAMDAGRPGSRSMRSSPMGVQPPRCGDAVLVLADQPVKLGVESGLLDGQAIGASPARLLNRPIPLCRRSKRLPAVFGTSSSRPACRAPRTKLA